MLQRLVQVGELGASAIYHRNTARNLSGKSVEPSLHHFVQESSQLEGIAGTWSQGFGVVVIQQYLVSATFVSDHGRGTPSRLRHQIGFGGHHKDGHLAVCKHFLVKLKQPVGLLCWTVPTQHLRQPFAEVFVGLPVGQVVDEYKAVERIVKNRPGAAVAARAPDVPKLNKVRFLRGCAFTVLVQLYFYAASNCPKRVSQGLVVAE